MGQRLVVTITANNEPKMKIYYHWSAYTMSAFDELNELWKIIKPLKEAGKSTEEILLGIIHGLEGHVDEEMKKWLQMMYPEQAKERPCRGGIDGGKDSDEWKYITALYPNETFAETVDRNNGLVAMSDKGMNEMQDWSEGNAGINLDTGTFYNDINWVYDGKEDYIDRLSYDRCGESSDEETVDELAKEYDNLPTYKGDGQDLFEGSCDDIETNMKAISDVIGNGYQFKDSGGTVWELTA